MNDPILLGACILLAFIALTAAVGIYGIICVTMQCVRHCKQIWKLHKQREG